MKVKVLIADDDMDAHQLLYDVIELNFRDVEIERALSLATFWAKVDAAEKEGAGFWQYIFVSIEYISEDPQEFSRRLNETDFAAKCKIVVVGAKNDFDSLDDEIKKLPFLEKPFSLDAFEALTEDAGAGGDVA